MRSTSQVGLVGAPPCLAVANIAQRARWNEVEDGVLWRASDNDVVAVEVAPGTGAARAGLQVGDVLLAVDGRPVTSPQDVVQILHASSRGTPLHYTVLRLRTQQMVDISVEPIPSSPRGLYFMLASVGMFSLLVGASVRLRRPDHQATLHFFWLTVAFFGVLAFSFTGQLDPLDWVFYWGDLIGAAAAAAAVPALRARVPRSAGRVGAERRRAHAAAAAVSAGAAAGRGVGRAAW